MEFIKTDFRDLLIVKHNIYSDSRGFFKEKFKHNEFENFINQKVNFCQHNNVKSNLNVLRGLHYQIEPFAQSKLISVSYGKILDIAVDIRLDSNTYGKYFSRILDANNHESLFIPKGFAHGYLTITDFALVDYNVDNLYMPEMERGIPFNDTFLDIDWGVNDDKLIISEKDRNQNSFSW